MGRGGARADVVVAIGLVLEVDGEHADGSPMLPFALRELDVLAPCRREMWVWVAAAGDDSATVRKLWMGRGMRLVEGLYSRARSRGPRLESEPESRAGERGGVGGQTKSLLATARE